MMGSDVSGHLGNSPFLPDWVRQECLTYMGPDSEAHQIADAPELKHFAFLVFFKGPAWCSI